MFVKEIHSKVEDKKQVVKIIKKSAPSLEERGVTKKDIMQKAKKAKLDDFFTRLEDIEKELSMYKKSIWKNKVVFCNCDDAVDDDNKNTSAFALYFLQHFKELEVKKLICTHYADSQLDLFNQGTKGYIFTKNGFSEIGNKEYPKNYNGSFDHELSIKILNEEADIVCTNPPFSRAKDFWDILLKSEKKFIIVSNETNVKNKAYMKYFKENKVWPGYNDLRWFLTPRKELTRAAAFWFTNIPINDRQKYKNLKIIPLKEIPEKYKYFDDDKILVVDYCYIPNDYKKYFAVSTTPILSGILEKGYKLVKDSEYVPYKKKKRCFGRVLIQKI
jgi:hypothetical protein